MAYIKVINRYFLQIVLLEIFPYLCCQFLLCSSGKEKQICYEKGYKVSYYLLLQIVLQ